MFSGLLRGGSLEEGDPGLLGNGPKGSSWRIQEPIDQLGILFSGPNLGIQIDHFAWLQRRFAYSRSRRRSYSQGKRLFHILPSITRDQKFSRFQALGCLIDKKTGEKSKTRPRFVKQDQICIMRLESQEIFCVEPFDVFPQMGRFVLRDEGKQSLPPWGPRETPGAWSWDGPQGSSKQSLSILGKTIAIGKVLKVIE